MNENLLEALATWWREADLMCLTPERFANAIMALIAARPVEAKAEAGMRESLVTHVDYALREGWGAEAIVNKVISLARPAPAANTEGLREKLQECAGRLGVASQSLHEKNGHAGPWDGCQEISCRLDDAALRGEGKA